MDLLSLFAQSSELKYYETSWFAATALIVIVVLSYLLGRTIARSVQMNDHGWKLGVIFFSIIFSTYYIRMNWPPRFGVDLKGGVTFIVDLNLNNDPEKVIRSYLAYDKDGNGVTVDEFPADQAHEFRRIDDDRNGVATEAEIRKWAEQNAEENAGSTESVENVIDQLKKRVDPAGIHEVDMRALGDDQIEIVIPDVDQTEADRIFERIKKAGYLQFRIVALMTEQKHSSAIAAAQSQANNANADLRGRTEVRSGDRVVARWVNVGRLDARKSKTLGLKNRPFRYSIPYNGPTPNVLVRNSATGVIVENIPAGPPKSAFAGSNEAEVEAAYERFYSDPKLKAAFHADWWAETQQKDNPGAEMQVLVIEPSENENVEGQDLVTSMVRQGIDRTGRPAVEFTLKRQAVSKFSRLTGNNINLPLGIVLDGELLSVANINSKIYKNGIIEGDFTTRQVQDLISILKAGQLKTTLQSPDGGGDLIDSTMGQEMKEQGFYAIAVSFFLVLAFMAIYYRIAGFVACLALVLNLLMILAIIMMLKQPLTLSGLAGLVLTVGMSVDANVLIFERIREELAKEATLRMAIRNGFQRATTTIVDANITTFITAFILYVIGNEQLKSFSVALMLGIVLSMFTAIFCSRVLFDIFEKKRWLKTLGMAKLLTQTNVNFIGKRTVAFAVSVLFIAVGIAAVFARGKTMLSQDLAGGSMARVVFAKEMDLATINKTLDKIAEENPVNDAPAEISAAEVTSRLYPDNTYYRIVSNIKSKDGSKSLADLLKEGFGDSLARSKFDVSSVNTVSLSSGSPAGNNPESGKGKNEPKGNPPKVDDNAGMIDAASGQRKFLPVSFVQDKSAGAGKDNSKSASNSDSKSVTGPTISQGSEPKQGTPDGSGKPGEQGKTDQEKNAAKEKNADSKQDSAAKQGSGLQADPGVDRSSGFQGGTQDGSQGGGSASTVGIYRTTARIRFGLNVEGAKIRKKASSLKSDFEEAARSLQFDNYTRNNIRLRDAIKGGDFIGDDVNYEAEEWEVEITTQGADHGSRILEAMKKKYDGQIFLPQSKEVGERFAQKAWLRAFAAMFASLIGIVAYIWVRFQRVSFGLAAVVALIHDVLVVVGAIAVSYWFKDFLGIILVEDFKISLAVIAALLTIIGYSLNDTIVVFDRIREVRGKNPLMTGEMVNRSINQTLSRTILTSLTTFIVVAILYGAGGDAIHGFAFALVVGVVVGTYSSIFVASPVLLMLMKREAEVSTETE